MKTIRVKILAAISALVFLSILASGIAIYYTSSLKNNIVEIGDWRIPLVNNAVELHAGAYQASIDQLSYVLYEDEKHFKNAMTNLDQMTTAVQKGEQIASKFNDSAYRNSVTSVQKRVDEFRTLYQNGVRLLKDNVSAVSLMVESGDLVVRQAKDFARKQEIEYAALLQGRNNQRALNEKVQKYIIVNRIMSQAMTIIRHEKEERLYKDRRFYNMMVPELNTLMGLYNDLQNITENSEELKLIRVARTNTKKYSDAAASWIKNDDELKFILPKMDELSEIVRNDATKVENQSWKLVTDTSVSASNEAEFAKSIAWIALSLAFLGGIAIAIWVNRSVILPLNTITGVMGTLAGGDYEIEVPGQDREDEIGVMAGAVEGFKLSALERIRLEQESREAEQVQLQREEEERKASAAREKAEAERKAAEVAEREDRANNINELITSFDSKVTEMMEVMSSSSTEMSATAKELVATSSDTKKRSSIVATASDETANNVNMVAAAAEELTSSVQEISRQVTKASDISLSAVSEAKKSEASIIALADAAEKINDVIGIISDIAEQTNLLALNATIESARAGEAGKGFAVVASEVKELAGQTSSATDEISNQIKEMQNLTKEAVNSVKSIVDVNNKSNEVTVNIQAAVEEQSAATNEISQNIQQVAKGTNEVSSNITRVAEGAEETGSAGDQVLSVADELGKISNTLKKDIELFLSNVRAA